MQRLFVYGSLGPGRPNEHLMQKIGGQWPDRLAEHWPALDEFEGTEYRRVATRVTLADGAQVDAYVYALRD